MKIWDVHYAFRPQVPSLLVENMRIHRAATASIIPTTTITSTATCSSARPTPSRSTAATTTTACSTASLTVDGLTFDGIRTGDMPLIQISDDNPTGKAESHFRNVKVIDWHDDNKRGAGQPRRRPAADAEDADRACRSTCTTSSAPARTPRSSAPAAKDYGKDGLTYRADAAADRRRIARGRGHRRRRSPNCSTRWTTCRRRRSSRTSSADDGKVRGPRHDGDNGTVTKVMVNGQAAKSLSANFAEWEVVLDEAKAGEVKVSAFAEDAAGNVEKRPHVVVVRSE